MNLCFDELWDSWPGSPALLQTLKFHGHSIVESATGQHLSSKPHLQILHNVALLYSTLLQVTIDPLSVNSGFFSVPPILMSAGSTLGLDLLCSLWSS